MIPACPSLMCFKKKKKKKEEEISRGNTEGTNSSEKKKCLTSVYVLLYTYICVKIDSCGFGGIYSLMTCVNRK